MQVFKNKEIASIDELVETLLTVPDVTTARDFIDECNFANLGYWTMKTVPATEDEYGYYEVTVQYISGDTGELAEKTVRLPFNIKQYGGYD